jgi:hypothetical protein
MTRCEEAFGRPAYAVADPVVMLMVSPFAADAGR